MLLQIMTDYPITSDYETVLQSVVADEANGFFTAYEVFEDVADLEHTEVLALGKVPPLPAGYRVLSAPSVRETLATAGGATKLRWAIRNLVESKPDVRFTWNYATPTTRLEVDPDVLYAVDIETSGNIKVDEPEDTELLALSIGWFRHGDEIEAVVFDYDALQQEWAHDMLRSFLGSARTVAHNGQFDFRWINSKLGSNFYPAEDTMLMHHARFPGAGEHGLKELCRRILDAPNWEAEAKSYTNSSAYYERIPQPILCEYNAYDVYWTLRLHEYLSGLMDETAWRLYREHTMPASNMLQDVEAAGFRVDQAYAEELGAMLDAETTELKKDLSIWVDNPNSTKQVVAALKQHFNIDSPSVAKPVLLHLEAKHPNTSEFIMKMLQYRKASKSRSTYVTSVLRKVRNNRVHPSFKVHGTTTGRLSSSGPNIQNVTNDERNQMSIRRMYTCDEGNVLVGADYAQAEARTMAELSGDEKMIEDFQEGAPDFFNNMMPEVFPHTNFEELDAEGRAPFRLRLKRIVYGSSYGLKPATVSQMLTLEGEPTTKQEAQAILDGYLARYPKLAEWRDGILPGLAGGSEMFTPFGRRFQLDVLTQQSKGRAENQGLAFQPQSIASDICIRAAMYIHQAFKKMPGCRIIAIVHDAIYAEVPERLGEEVRALMELKMREAAATVFHRVPFLTDSKIGKYWNEV